MYCLILKNKFNIYVYSNIKSNIKYNHNFKYFNFNFIFKFNNISKKKYLNFYFYYNKKFYHNFGYINKLYYNNFINILFIFFNTKNNILIIDEDYNHILPIYNIIYGKKNLNLEKNFFFLKKKYLTFQNWNYSYNNFLNKYSISGLFFLNYYNFNKFFNIFVNFKLPIFTFLDENSSSEYIDYFFYISNNININKIIIYNMVSSLFFYNYNLNINLQKNKFLNYYNIFLKHSVNNFF